MEKLITSAQHKLIKHIKKLDSRADRQAYGAFFIEGEKMVREALCAGARIKNLLIEQSATEKYMDVQSALRGNCEITLLSETAMNAISRQKTRQNIAALIELPKNPGIDELGNKIIFLDGVQDPGNVGTIIRTADAAGLSGVALSGECADAYSDKALRATMGSIFRLRVHQAQSTADFMLDYTAAWPHSTVIAAVMDGQNIYDIALDCGGGFVIAVGSEGRGVSQQVFEKADIKATIPMRGGAESLNVAVASGIIMYELMKNNKKST